MSTNSRRNTVKATLLAAALLAACLLGRPASAQNIQGSFTLQHETRWGQAVLPPGDYQLTFTINNVGPMLVIRDAKSGVTVAFESLAIREDSTAGESNLLIGTWGERPVVYSLTIAELGEAFVYQRPPAHNRKFEEARQTETVPVLVAKR